MALSRLTFDFRSRAQVAELVTLEGPAPSIFVPTLAAVVLGQQTDLDLGLSGLRPRYLLQATAKWFRRGGAGPTQLPGVALSCDPLAALTLEQLARDARFHRFRFSRHDPRLATTSVVRVHLRGRIRQSPPAIAHLTDLSRGGAFIALSSFPQNPRDPLAPPPLLELGVDLPEAERPLVVCRVRWTGFLNGERGFGCSFLRPDQRARGEIGRLLQLAAGVPPKR